MADAGTNAEDRGGRMKLREDGSQSMRKGMKVFED